LFQLFGVEIVFGVRLALLDTKLINRDIYIDSTVSAKHGPRRQLKIKEKGFPEKVKIYTKKNPKESKSFAVNGLLRMTRRLVR